MRWVGQFVDGLVVMLVPGVIFIAGIMRIPTYYTTCEAWDPATGAVIEVGCEQPEVGPTMALLGFVAIVWFIAFFMVVISPIGISGQSIGMRMVGVRAVDEHTLRPIGLGRSFLRAVSAWFLSGWFSLGYIWALFDSRNQTWHDKIARTVVVSD